MLLAFLITGHPSRISLIRSGNGPKVVAGLEGIPGPSRNRRSVGQFRSWQDIARLEFLQESGLDIAVAIYMIGAVAIIVLGVILYRSRLETGSWGPKSIGQWIWYTIVAEIAWYVVASLGLGAVL